MTSKKSTYPNKKILHYIYVFISILFEELYSIKYYKTYILLEIIILL